ncbi:MAG: vitamin K epoxide reductase family protein [Caldilineales bacterium]|nr:vitamin K epoxide reductase family protein [Caldilineales bacterium]
MSLKRILFFILALVLLLAPASALAQEQPGEPVVHALLFYSPTCPHCHEVLQNGLPPLMEKYGDQLQIILADVTTPGGQMLYRSATSWLPIPEDKGGVPALIVGRELLVGSVEIPQRLPGIVESGLAAGGIPWPEVPGMADVLAQMEAREAAAPQAETETAGLVEETSPEPVSVEPEPILQSVDEASTLTPGQRFMLDPAGGTFALLLLLGMIISVILLVIVWRRGRSFIAVDSWLNWAIPILALIGLAVAGYLAYVETTQATAVCGPVGDCNAVQQSPYARLFGVLPIGVLGMIGYAVILALWLWQRYGPEDAARRSGWLLPVTALFGVIFSIYLTFLEPFVIGAVCIWCLTSALIMTLLLWLAVGWYLGRSGASSEPASALG